MRIKFFPVFLQMQVNFPARLRNHPNPSHQRDGMMQCSFCMFVYYILCDAFYYLIRVQIGPHLYVIKSWSSLEGNN